MRRETKSTDAEIILPGNSASEDVDGLHLTKGCRHIRRQLFIALLPRLSLGVDPKGLEGLRSLPCGDSRDPRNIPAPAQT